MPWQVCFEVSHSRTITDYVESARDNLPDPGFVGQTALPGLMDRARHARMAGLESAAISM